MTAKGPPVLFVADGRAVRRVDGTGAVLPFPGGPQAVPPSPNGVLAVDWNSDYRMDLVFAGAGGLKVFEQKEDGTFADVTAATKLDPGILASRCLRRLGGGHRDGRRPRPRAGSRAGERCPCCGTTATARSPRCRPFEGATDLRDFAWADLDGDGDPDAALLDARGGLRIYTNERAGRFQPRPGPEGLGTLAALAVADLNSDGVMDLLAMRADGTVLRISDRDDGHAWDMVEVVRSPADRRRMRRASSSRTWTITGPPT